LTGRYNFSILSLTQIFDSFKTLSCLSNWFLVEDIETVLELIWLILGWFWLSFKHVEIRISLLGGSGVRHIFDLWLFALNFCLLKVIKFFIFLYLSWL
jgi:hypothetical protein